MASSIVTLGFEGGLDVSRQPEIAKHFAECPTGGAAVVIEMSRTKWIDSTVVTELLLFYRTNQKLGRTVVIVAQGNVARMLMLAGIARRIPIFSDLESAIKKLRGARRQAPAAPKSEAHQREIEDHRR